MGRGLQCWLRFCCPKSDDNDDDSECAPAVTRRSSSASSGTGAAGSQVPALPGRISDRRHNSTYPDIDLLATKNPHAASIHEFFRQLRHRFRRYDSVESVATQNETDDWSLESPPTDLGDPMATPQHFHMRRPAATQAGLRRATSAPTHGERSAPMAPVTGPLLRAASSYDSSRADYLTIRPDEIVLPGSTLQAEMARAMKKYSFRHQDECVICMEGFDVTNPRMPTLCGCGANRTYFHLPCLYQWTEQSNECPSCRQKLTWEEF